MKNLLEELWYSYDMTDTNENEEQRSELLNLIVLNEDRLKETLNEKETETLKNLEDCIDELNHIAQKQAFMKGVRFAVSFMCEALGSDF